MKPQRMNLGSLTPYSTDVWLRNHSRVLGGQVSFGATSGNNEQDRNIFCSKATGTTPGTANTEFSVAHNLGRVPVTFFGHTNNGGILYQSTTPWTKTTIFLKCTTVSAVFAIVII